MEGRNHGTIYTNFITRCDIRYFIQVDKLGQKASGKINFNLKELRQIFKHIFNGYVTRVRYDFRSEVLTSGSINTILSYSGFKIYSTSHVKEIIIAKH